MPSSRNDSAWRVRTRPDERTRFDGSALATRSIFSHDEITATSLGRCVMARTSSNRVGECVGPQSLSRHGLGLRPEKISVYPGSETKFGPEAAIGAP